MEQQEYEKKYGQWGLNGQLGETQVKGIGKRKKQGIVTHVIQDVFSFLLS